ncbi:hypothetical protein D3C81_575130 [compost metagenome]
MGATEIPRPQAGGQPVAAVVGHAHGLGFVVEAKHRQHRAEHFLAGQRLLRPHLVEHRRLHIATARLHLGTLAAQQQPRAIGFGAGDVGQYFVHMRGIDQRPHRCIRLQRMAWLHALAVGDHLVHEVIADRTLHQQPRTGRADLPLVEEDALRHALGRRIQVRRIGEHHVRALATAFQPDPLEVGTTGVLQQLRAGRGGAGEGQHVHVHVQGERLTHA